MVFFTGTMKVRVVEAADLLPTERSDEVTTSGTVKPAISPYVSVDLDECQIGRTATKSKTAALVWDEEFNTEVQAGRSIGFTLFDDSAISADVVLAHCRIPFEDLLKHPANDIWVTLEPSGRLHLLVELSGTASEVGLCGTPGDRNNRRRRG